MRVRALGLADDSSSVSPKFPRPSATVAGGLRGTPPVLRRSSELSKMPPPARVCQACKASKVRCEDFEHGEECKRCKRLGLKCEPAPQRPKTMPIANQFKRKADLCTASSGPPATLACTSSPCTTLSLTSIDYSDSASAIFREVVGEPELEVLCLRQMTAIARSRNAYKLMGRIIKTCYERSIDLNRVLSVPTEDIIDAGSSVHSFEVLQAVSASAGYCSCRSVSPSGKSYFFNNAAFEHAIMSLEAIQRAYAANEAEVFSYFIHPEDMDVLRPLLGRNWRKGARKHAAGQLVIGDSSPPVRVKLRKNGEYIACHARVSIHCRLESGWFSMALELLPLDVGEGSQQEAPPARIEEPALPRYSGGPNDLFSPLTLTTSSSSSNSDDMEYVNLDELREASDLTSLDLAELLGSPGRRSEVAFDEDRLHEL